MRTCDMLQGTLQKLLSGFCQLISCSKSPVQSSQNLQPSTPPPFWNFSENSSDLAPPFFPYLRHLSNLQVYDSGSRGRIIILYYSYDITNCGRVYKTGTLHLIHDDSQKNLENNKTLAKLCMYYCDHKIIFNLSLFPKIFSSRSLSSSFCRRSSWFQMTR